MKNLRTKLRYTFYALLALVFVNCTTRTHNYDWEWSKEQCKDKLGVRYYNAEAAGCRCNDGEWVNRN